MSSFHVDGRITVKMEYDLAVQLGEFIQANRPEDQRLRALGRQLTSLEDNAPNDPYMDRSSYAEDMIRSTGQIISDAQSGSGSFRDSLHKPPINIRPKFIPKSF
jgi:hypothetical protein